MSRYILDTTFGDALDYIGSVTLNGATPVSVSNVPLKAKRWTIQWGLQTIGGTVGATPTVQTFTPSSAGGTAGPQGNPPFNGSMTVAGSAGDTSTYQFRIFN
jgi:hypothetical protein